MQQIFCETDDTTDTVYVVTHDFRGFYLGSFGFLDETRKVPVDFQIEHLLLHSPKLLGTKNGIKIVDLHEFDTRHMPKTLWTKDKVFEYARTLAAQLHTNEGPIL